MKKILTFSLLAIAIFGALYYKSLSTSPLRPEPEDDEEDWRKEKWLELIHKAAPGTDWRRVEAGNEDMLQAWRNNYLAAKPLNTLVESFANGALQGNWEEKGSNNQAGRNFDGAYDSVANNYYAISNNGTMWRKNVASGSWTELNKNLRYSHNVLKVLKKANGSNRILASRGSVIGYSDDEGQTFTFSTGAGINSPQQVVAVNDASQSVYCLSPGGLYRSTDLGQTFTKIFNITFATNYVTINKSHNSNQVYLLDNYTTGGTLKLYTVNGASVTLFNTATTGQTGKAILRSVLIGSVTTFYALVGDTKVYKSTNNGVSWTLQSTVSSSPVFEVSMDDPQKLFIGNVEASRSYDGGLTWTLLNTWGAYYADPLNKLHADIMQFNTFRKPDNTAVFFVNCDGGTYLSTNDLLTVSNISMTTLRNSEYYDVLTDPDQPNRLFAGSQDQGFQRNTTATTPGPLDFVQVISGDYGYLTLTGNPKHLWTQYPGGAIYYYDNPLGNASATYTIPGTQKPNYGWMLPVANTYTGRNEVLMAGGNLTGGGGSYLARLTASPPPVTITGTQFNYDFRANSNSTTAGITAIETVKNDTNRIYVATEDGSFFYSTNGGANWSKSVSFSGPTPWYLYGSSIYSSRLTPDLVWYAGTGYSNPGVYKSVNGGQSFVPMNNGLPSTLVYQIVANPTETMIFAGTEAGPYVYVVADNQWYPMLGAVNPLHTYNIVEYIEATNTVRFGTYGRGIWDFVVTNAPPPTPVVTSAGSTSFCEGNSLTLQSSIATGNQWYKNGVAITGATGTTYTATQSGNYYVKATINSQTSNASNTVVVTVFPLPATPAITASGPLSVCEGNSVTLSSSSTVSNQWYKDAVLIPGATAATYVATQTGNYSVKAVTTAGCTSNASPAVTVIVSSVPPAPVVTAGGPTTICAGSQVQLTSSAASGNQWYQNNVAIATATSQTLTVTQAGSYTAIATSNGCPSTPSTAIGITVNPVPLQPTITLTSGKLTSSAASGNQWYVNNTLIPYATASTYIPAIAGNYSVQVISNGCKSPMSNIQNVGVAATGLQSQVLIAPNPVHQNMVVVSTSGDPLKLELFDNKGRLLMNKTFTGSADISMLLYPPSTYVVRITNTKTKEHWSRQVVKVN